MKEPGAGSWCIQAHGMISCVTAPGEHATSRFPHRRSQWLHFHPGCDKAEGFLIACNCLSSHAPYRRAAWRRGPPAGQHHAAPQIAPAQVPVLQGPAQHAHHAGHGTAPGQAHSPPVLLPPQPAPRPTHPPRLQPPRQVSEPARALSAGEGAWRRPCWGRPVGWVIECIWLCAVTDGPGRLQWQSLS